jgi:hypothetical protein
MPRRLVLFEHRAVLPDELEVVPADRVLVLRLGCEEMPRHDELQGAFGGNDVDLHRGRVLCRRRL